MTSRPLIALDGDGVLLDYNLAYARAWEKATGRYPAERDLKAYWAMDRWDVKRLSGENLERFRTCFDYLPYMLGVDGSIHTALILRDPYGSPNRGAGMQSVGSTHANLDEFYRYCFEEQPSPKLTKPPFE